MAENAKLKVSTRDAVGKGAASGMRRNGIVPGVLYGKDSDSCAITSDEAEITDIIERGEQIFTADVSDGPAKGEHQVLLREVQWNSLSSELLHFDLQTVAKGQVIEVTVPLNFKGEAIGQQDGGVVDLHVHELTVECTPANVPENITVDLSDLQLHDSIHVSDIKAIDGVTILEDGEEVLASCHMPQEEEELTPEEAPVEGEMEPEVITEKKHEEENAEE